MTAAVFVAKRSLISGHTVGQEYPIELRCVEGGLQVGRKVGSAVQRSLSDRTETLYFFGKVTYQITVLALTLAERLLLEEFLHSTEAQESFTFSPFGTTGVLGATIVARRTDGAYTYERLDNTGATREADAVRVSFSIEAT